MKIRNYILFGWLVLATFFFRNAYADDLTKGIKGPTNNQIDIRLNAGLESITNTLILKYWDGKEKGKWIFLAVPYKFNYNKENGTGDITIGAGPRWTIGNLHLLTYGSLKMPTEEIGSNRFDENIGLLATYLIDNFEIDLATEYTFTGKDKEGNNPPNSYYIGTVAGVEFASKWKLATGLTSQLKGNDYSLTARGIVRYTPSKYIHLELVGDIDLSRKNMPKKTGISLYTRINF